MDVERIERALRRGPPDEPVYVPGAFHQPRFQPWLLAAMGVAVIAVLLTGIMVGMSLQALRGDGVGGSRDPIVAADLEGEWISDEIGWQDWVDGMVAHRFQPADIGDFLIHDPFEETVRYQLEFVGGVLTIRASYDGQPIQTLSGGSYTVVDSALRYREELTDPPGVGEACEVVAELDIAGDRLTMAIVDMGACGLDARMAHTAFFELSGFSRVDPYEVSPRG